MKRVAVQIAAQDPRLAFAQPSDGRLKIIHETATLRVAYRTDSQPFSYVDAQGRPVGYTIELCERIARSLEAQLNVALTIKWVSCRRAHAVRRDC